MKQQCRCCLATDSNYYFNIYERHKCGITYAENICQLAKVQINHDDGLPQQICSTCYDELNRAYEFGLNVRLADEKLRQELQVSKTQLEVEDQMENVQVLENEYFTPVDENDIQVCVMEEILEQEPEQENLYIVEEIQEVDEGNITEEIFELGKDETNTYNQKENLLVGLAQVACTQENVNIEYLSAKLGLCYPQDDNDEHYLIEFDPNEINNFKPSKWKCVECKVILRGDVSYEGHMNIHKQSRPHKCPQCQTEFRCRTALKRHKELRHTVSIRSKDSSEENHICLTCNKNFSSIKIFHIHQALTHGLGDKCPFQCDDRSVNNLREHIVGIHQNDLNCTVNNNPSSYQCFKCSHTFENVTIFESHAKLCQNIEELQLDAGNMNIETKNIIEIVNVETPEIWVRCNVCRKKLLNKNINKHMELHKRKEEESKSEEKTKICLCSYCPREFKNSKSLYQHEKNQHAEICDVIYACGDCERQYASQYLLDTHRKQAHKERDNICNICGNAFKLRNQLMNHMKLHLEKNIPCPHCDKKYARQFDLNVHLRSHTGEQPYGCHLCEKRFAIKVRLTYHLQKHYGIKHYCKECGAEFNSKQKLKAHSFKHTGMPYRCQLCDDHGFATRNTFKRHLTRVHHAAISEEALNEMFQRNTGKSVNIKQIDEHNIVISASEDDNQEMIEVMGK